MKLSDIASQSFSIDVDPARLMVPLKSADAWLLAVVPLSVESPVVPLSLFVVPFEPQPVSATAIIPAAITAVKKPFFIFVFLDSSFLFLFLSLSAFVYKTHLIDLM